MELQAGAPEAYLGADDVVEASAPEVVELAARLRAEHPGDTAFARAAFEWVRDEVAHSVDAQDPRITVTATEVLERRVGLCFAKSHLLAAVLRAGRVPAGLCYQRFGDGDAAMLHGLVAVHLDGAWSRQDPRGNKPGVDAQFSLGAERLAWPADPAAGDLDYPQVLAAPAPVVLAALRGSDDALALCAGGLPGAL
ncbi:transglutaminase-like domain-containing protein [Antribacter gilvus]|uniref:transglutaminase-like domain-containing protein n=1 Tax=Antribacter gilvus TaxID=2304675 RepID=UPI000F797947|nr:transglutaminase family protein [Antribacter gilvus]